MRTTRPVDSDWAIHHHLDITHRNLERMQAHVAIADNKALIALTFQGAIIAGFAIIGLSLRSQVQRQSLPVKWLFIVLMVLFLTTFLVSTWKLFQAISPRVTPLESKAGPSALFFFGSVAAMEEEEFMARMRGLEPEDVHDGLLRTTRAVARIATEKYRNLRTAYICLGIQMLFFMVAALLVIL